MKRRLLLWLVVGLVLAAFTLPANLLGSTALERFDLAKLTERAERIFRGTVIDVSQEAVEAGGAQLPAVKYVLKVEESFKGSADQVKGEDAVIEIMMIGSIKNQPAEGNLRQLSVFADVPRLKMGQDYLLFTTAKSAVGLSTTVGLGQGSFRVFTQDKELFAVNELDNAGLGLEQNGPAKYSELTQKILALLSQ